MLKGIITFRRGSIIGNIWEISISYWGDKEKIFTRYALAALLVGLTFFQTYCYTLSNAAMSNYMEVIQKRDATHWLSALSTNFLVHSLTLSVAAGVTFVTALLALLWRSWFTKDLVKKWIQKNAFYKVERFENLDNPDQRISEDCNQFTSWTIKLTFGLLGTLSSFFTFSYVAISKGGPLDLMYGGHNYHIPGGTFVLSLLWSALATVATVIFARNLLKYTINLQASEADFRFSAAMIREYSEQIALLRGNLIEIKKLDKNFDNVFKSNLKLAVFNFKFSPFTGVISWLTSVVADIFLMPRYFSGGISLSDLMQVSGSIQMISYSMMWIANNFSDIQTYRAVVTRVAEMTAAIGAADDSLATVHRTTPDRDLIVENVSVNLPNGNPLIKEVNFSIRRGEKIWLRGASGEGKSTLFRALAGIWPYSNGIVNLPEGSVTSVLPQETYMPTGTLKAALAYPDEAKTVSDQECVSVLTASNLQELIHKLHETEKWQSVLSPGQRQRVAFARVLLKKPDFIFMDEATSALDAVNEEAIYRLFHEELSGAGLISISHRSDDMGFYNHVLELNDGKLSEIPNPGSEA